ncbi:CmcI family methyltransferase [Sinorhizobium meliloti]|uniref:CmcI family methyltransferase n=1 Tax=Rhizobium meliloti TaxID=382 RepID=UPI000FD82643|nr:CmcI family methyltransferase [Sinorhizobium meliloti]RVP20771.1 rhamnosyl O-methyltransferase [Sinorhizobium meliloti]
MNHADPVTEFHRWYYDAELWNKTYFLGVRTLKCVFDLWQYQEILTELRPDLVVETGCYLGGATLFFSTILEMVNPNGQVITVETNPDRIDPSVRARSNIEIIAGSSTDPTIASLLRTRRAACSGLAFFIFDARPRKDHVLSEMINFREVIQPSDYLVVEDSNVNGHPVLPEWGPGPMEAIREYEKLYPADYVHDEQREQKFGVTFAPYGFMRRR